MTTKTVTRDLIHPYLKAYAALVGSVATGLLAVYTPDTTIGHGLTVAAIIATAIATFVVPNVGGKPAPAPEGREEPLAPKPVAGGDEPLVPDTDGYIGEHEAGR